MRKIKLIGLDLDGTLLDDKKELSERNREVLCKAAKQGVEIVPATGRPLVGLMPEVMSLPIKYALTANGAAVYEIEGRKKIVNESISWQLAERVLGMLGEYDVMADCFMDGHGYGETNVLKISEQFAMPEVVRAYIKATRRQVDNLTTFIHENQHEVEKITVNFREKNGILQGETEIKQRLQKEYPELTVVKGVPTNLEITMATATKGTGILKLGEYLGITREEIMVCGDSQNDLEMIKAAGFGVAMANATQQVKEAADYVTLSNEEDGVAAVVEKFVLK